MKKLYISLAFISVVAQLTACGGGGGGGSDDGFLGIFRGILFLTSNTCSFASDDQLNVVYTTNSNSERTVVDETINASDGVFSRAFSGPPLGDGDTFTVTSQETDNCVFRDGTPSGSSFTIVRTLTFTRDGQFLVDRTQDVSKCSSGSGTECSRAWTGTVTKD